MGIPSTPRYASPVVAITHATQAAGPAREPCALGSSLSNLRWLHAIHQPTALHAARGHHVHAEVPQPVIRQLSPGSPEASDSGGGASCVPDVDDQAASHGTEAHAASTSAGGSSRAARTPLRFTANNNSDARGSFRPASPGARSPSPSLAPTKQHEPGTKEYFAADASCRPPYSYPAIVYMSMKATGKARVQLTEIYTNIIDQWAYYAARPRESGWKNSIRHNLTVCKCFHKVSRQDGDTGKGGYWSVNEKAASTDIVLLPRGSMIKAAAKSKAKSKKTGKGAQARGSAKLGGTGPKPMPKGSSSSRRGKGTAPTTPTRRPTDMDTEPEPNTDAPLHLESMLDDELPGYPLMMMDSSEMATAMSMQGFDIGDRDRDHDHDGGVPDGVPDSCSVTIHGESMSPERGDGHLLTHSMLDNAPLLNTSFSNFLDCAKDLNASHSFSALTSRDF